VKGKDYFKKYEDADNNYGSAKNKKVHYTLKAQFNLLQ